MGDGEFPADRHVCQFRLDGPGSRGDEDLIGALEPSAPSKAVRASSTCCHSSSPMARMVQPRAGARLPALRRPLSLAVASLSARGMVCPHRLGPVLAGSGRRRERVGIDLRTITTVDRSYLCRARRVAGARISRLGRADPALGALLPTDSPHPGRGRPLRRRSLANPSTSPDLGAPIGALIRPASCVSWVS